MGSTLAGVWGAIFWEGYETISGHRHLYSCRGKGQGILFSVTFNLPHHWCKRSNDWGWVYFSFYFLERTDMGQPLNSLYETGSQNTSELCFGSHKIRIGQAHIANKNVHNFSMSSMMSWTKMPVCCILFNTDSINCFVAFFPLALLHIFSICLA